jgi:hypothetical protein
MRPVTGKGNLATAQKRQLGSLTPDFERDKFGIMEKPKKRQR